MWHGIMYVRDRVARIYGERCDDVLNNSKTGVRHFRCNHAHLALRQWPTLCAIHPTNIIMSLMDRNSQYGNLPSMASTSSITNAVQFSAHCSSVLCSWHRTQGNKLLHMASWCTCTDIRTLMPSSWLRIKEAQCRLSHKVASIGTFN
jgi:hypothetical protein